jgi:hypothetical protein
MRRLRAWPRVVFRAAPWLLALAAGSIAWRLVPSPPQAGPLAAAPLQVQPAGDPPASSDCPALRDLSAEAAALTGALALVDAAGRSALAGRAARQIDALAAEAGAVEGGGALASVLWDLAGELSAYAAGDATAVGGVAAASARNAYLRRQFETCVQGVNDESF